MQPHKLDRRKPSRRESPGRRRELDWVRSSDAAALPGLVGRWFATTMEPPVKAFSKMKAMRNIKPGTSPSLADAFTRFLTSQNEIRDHLSTNADLDLAGIRFPNPLVPGIRFSLATGLHVITAHERRHIWQAWRVRRAAEDAAGEDVRLAV